MSTVPGQVVGVVGWKAEQVSLTITSGIIWPLPGDVHERISQVPGNETVGRSVGDVSFSVVQDLL